MSSQPQPDPARSSRRALRAAAVLWLFAAGACASQDTFKVCTVNGTTYLCPESLACGAAQAVCLTTGCGNAVLDPGEQCDDGNLNAGDGCSPVCQVERCGNRILDAGEACDDGNTVGGDGCSRDCRSTEVCGNGILDVEVGEVCDDGTGGSSACSADCRSTLSCNNFRVDPGEECDHGLFGTSNPTGNNDHSDCRADCVINRCGDGHVDSQPGPHHEDCDGAPTAPPGSVAATPTETAGCNLDCTFALCGDGVVNQTAGEQCDDHNLADNDGCSHDCRFEFCGDGMVNDGEVCDFTVTPATCNFDCTVSACGDNKVNHAAGEQCDDGNLFGGDGCSTACQFEHCGNGVVDPPEDCDGAAGLQPCSATCHQERCGNAILDDDDATGVHEQCDDGNLVNGDGCSHDCKFEFCGDGVVNNGEPCDRALTPATCNLDCTLSTCGDGKLNPAGGEQCDDGNLNAGDGCSPSCTLE